MEIRQLKKEDYAGRKFTARYQTNGYYDICVCEGGFRMRYTPFASPEERAFDDVFYAEGSPESWNGRFRLSNICIFERSARGKGVGTMLLKALEEAAEASSTRMLVLETQSCNEAAIGFYKRNGFAVIGFDLYAYSNDDPERHEVRIEMGKKLK